MFPSKTGKLTTLSGNLSTSTGKLSTFTGKLSTFHEMVPFKIISSTVPFERHCVVLYLLQGLFIIPLHYYAFGFFSVEMIAVVVGLSLLLLSWWYGICCQYTKDKHHFFYEDQELILRFLPNVTINPLLHWFRDKRLRRRDLFFMPCGHKITMVFYDFLLLNIFTVLFLECVGG